MAFPFFISSLIVPFIYGISIPKSGRKTITFGGKVVVS